MVKGVAGRWCVVAVCGASVLCMRAGTCVHVVPRARHRAQVTVVRVNAVLVIDMGCEQLLRLMVWLGWCHLSSISLGPTAASPCAHADAAA